MRSDDLAFGTPDWSLGLDLEHRLDQAPKDGKVLGWMFNSVLDLADRRGVPLHEASRFTPFASYPLADYLRLLALAAERMDATASPRENLYALGLEVYGAFTESFMGRMVSTALGQGGSARDALRWVARSYRLTSEHTRAIVVLNVEGRAIVHLRNVWSFPDVYHVGVFEGAARAVSEEPMRVRVCPVSLHECFIELARASDEPRRAAHPRRGDHATERQ